MPQFSQGRGWVIANTSQTPLGGDRHDVVITELSDEELVVIAAGGRTEDEMKVIPPTPSND